MKDEGSKLRRLKRNKAEDDEVEIKPAQKKRAVIQDSDDEGMDVSAAKAKENKNLVNTAQKTPH